MLQHSPSRSAARHLDRCSSATGIAALDPGTLTTALPAFAELGDADAVGRHYARLYMAYQGSRSRRTRTATE
jgi:hypothetical protein